MNGIRKFFLTAVASVVSNIALFCGFADFNQWIAAQTLILGMYKVANIVDKTKGGQG